PEGRAPTDEERTAANGLLEKAAVWHSPDSRFDLALAFWFPGTSRVMDSVARARETIKRLKQDGASPETLASAHFRLGQSLIGRDDAAAVAALRQAIRLMPDRVDYWSMLMVHLVDDDERIAECTAWIQSGPDSPHPYQIRGNAYIRGGLWAEALADS